MRWLTSSELQVAASLLQGGELVAFPTETVYGLGAPIFHSQAIQSIFTVKGRPADNPLIAHVSSIDQVAEIAREIPAAFYLLASHFFPGPLTVVLKRHPRVPSLVSAGLETVAVRMPSHPIALELIRLVKEPLVAPSANLSGRPSPTEALHVREDFDGKIAAVIDGGACEWGIESTVISLLGEQPVLMRPGSIVKEALEEVLGCAVLEPLNNLQAISSPGMKYRHYAPKAPIRLVYSLKELESCLVLTSGLKTLLLTPEKGMLSAPHVTEFVLTARALYRLLRFADAEHYQQIVILCADTIASDRALMNRLTKAAQ